MDADPVVCPSQTRFVQIATHLRGLELAAPEVLAFDDALGIMILSDLGTDDFRHNLKSNPDGELVLYGAAVDVLCRIQSERPPVGLTHMTPHVGTQMIDLAFEWAATDASQDLRDQITKSIRTLLDEVEPETPSLSLRDYHAENLIWRPYEKGLSRVGLLDFQDAFITHPVYDLVSLLRDARRDVDSELLTPLLGKLLRDWDEEAARKAFHVIAVQRNLRILGIFNRLAFQDRKSGYLSLRPRVWAHLQTDLAAPALAPIAPLINRAFGPKD